MARRNSKGRFVKGGGKARRSSSTAIVQHRAAPRSVVVVQGGGRSGKIKHYVRKVGGRSDVWGPLIMAAALGYAEKEGWEIPVIGTLGEEATIAVVGYGLLKLAPGAIPASLRKHVENLTLAAGVLAVKDAVVKGEFPGTKKKDKPATVKGAPNYVAHEVE